MNKHGSLGGVYKGDKLCYILREGDVAQWLGHLTVSPVMHASWFRTPLCGVFRGTALFLPSQMWLGDHDKGAVIHTAQHLTQHYPAKRQSQVHRANEPMLTRHLRRWPNIKTALGQCIAFAWETQCHWIRYTEWSSWISVALSSVTLLYKNWEKCPLSTSCYSTIVLFIMKKSLTNFLCVYRCVRFRAQLLFFYFLFDLCII